VLDLGRIDRSDDRAVFRQVAGMLREKIQRGELQPGDRLPSEADLAAHFEITRMTIRNAIQDLKNEGLVVSEHGRGVFVRAAPPVRRLASDRFARAHRERGKAAFLAEEVNTGPGGIYARIEEAGHTLSHFTEEVSARMPTPEERRELDMAAGVPVIVLVRTAFDTQGRPVEVCDTVKVASSYVLEYRVPATRKRPWPPSPPGRPSPPRPPGRSGWRGRLRDGVPVIIRVQPGRPTAAERIGTAGLPQHRQPLNGPGFRSANRPSERTDRHAPRPETTRIKITNVVRPADALDVATNTQSSPR